ncbi:hypothetical protein EVAR_78134_1 [Eumeta japonica]|uniref:Uncharacterized protein n=1 Tax=Eumeta variegata TaxID=151549 RepID=A0A4C1T0J9_EUMVA|nr:hypothetical protein EVAR_78134_1 [Eumeta japonica]
MADLKVNLAFGDDPTHLQYQLSYRLTVKRHAKLSVLDVVGESAVTTVNATLVVLCQRGEIKFKLPQSGIKRLREPSHNISSGRLSPDECLAELVPISGVEGLCQKKIIQHATYEQIRTTMGPASMLPPRYHKDYLTVVELEHVTNVTPVTNYRLREIPRCLHETLYCRERKGGLGVAWRLRMRSSSDEKAYRLEPRAADFRGGKFGALGNQSSHKQFKIRLGIRYVDIINERQLPALPQKDSTQPRREQAPLPPANEISIESLHLRLERTE